MSLTAVDLIDVSPVDHLDLDISDDAPRVLDMLDALAVEQPVYRANNQRLLGKLTDLGNKLTSLRDASAALWSAVQPQTNLAVREQPDWVLCNLYTKPLTD